MADALASGASEGDFMWVQLPPSAQNLVWLPARRQAGLPRHTRKKYMNKLSTAEKIQDEIYKKMTASQKIKLVNQFFEFGKKLSSLNDKKIDGNRRFINKNIKNT